jgi:hypothetical protein
VGIAADASSESPGSAARSLGLSGLVSASVADAAEGSGRWYALLIGVPVLVYTTRGVLRVLIGAHRLVWTDIRASAPRATLVETLRLLALLLCFPVITTTANAARAWSTGPGVLVSVVAIVPFAGVWLLITMRLPHRGADWKALIPGALFFALGAEVLQAVMAYAIAPYSIAKQGTYGVLGAAAALLFALYLVSRLVVASAVLGATLWERRNARRLSSRGGGRQAHRARLRASLSPPDQLIRVERDPDRGQECERDESRHDDRNRPQQRTGDCCEHAAVAQCARNAHTDCNERREVERGADAERERGTGSSSSLTCASVGFIANANRHDAGHHRQMQVGEDVTRKSARAPRHFGL